MIRVLIGTILLVAMVALKVLFNHNIDYWAAVKSWGVYMGFIGIIVWLTTSSKRLNF